MHIGRELLVVFYLLSNLIAFHIACLVRDIHADADELLTAEGKWQSVVLSLQN